MNIPRREMPQIAGKDLQHFFSYLKDQNIKVNKTSLDPNSLSPTQGHFHKAKIEEIKKSMEDGSYKTSPILVSKDDKVIDGHHRWLAHCEREEPVEAHVINQKADDLIDTMKDYPKSFTKKLYEMFEYLEEDAQCALVTDAQMKAFEKVVDDLFSRFELDFDFTKHFRERMSDSRNKPCITMKDLADTIKKIYTMVKSKGNTFVKFKDAEAVIKDLQSNINIPIKVEFSRKEDELSIVPKTIMRKKDFYSKDPGIEV